MLIAITKKAEQIFGFRLLYLPQLQKRPSIFLGSGESSQTPHRRETSFHPLHQEPSSQTWSTLSKLPHQDAFPASESTYRHMQAASESGSV